MASSFPGRAESTRASFCFLKAIRFLTVPLILENTSLNKIYPVYIRPLLKIGVLKFAVINKTPFGCVLAGLNDLSTLKVNSD